MVVRVSCGGATPNGNGVRTTMRDKPIVEPLTVQEIFCDGFTKHTVRNGNMSCVGYRIQEPSRETGEPVKIAVVRLIFPRDCVVSAIVEAQKALSALPVPINIGLRKAH